MSANNIAQVLNRNINSLAAKQPLFINLTDVSFISNYLEQYADSKVSCFTSNYQLYHAHNQHKNYQSFFGAHYQNNITHDLVVISYPKSKAELPMLLAMINEYVEQNTRIIIVGEKASGINSSQKIVLPYLTYYTKQDSARHCMLFSGIYQKTDKKFALDEWFNNYVLSIANISVNIAALPGVFSQKKIDIGTSVLLNNLPEKITGNLLDFGCGAGVIGCYLAKKYNNLNLSLADVSALALASTKKTLLLNNINADVIPCNSLLGIDGTFNCVITNPPFHQGIKTNYQVTESFLAGINQKITPKGCLIVVANSFLNYQPIMKNNFKRVKEVIKKDGFTVYSCDK